VLSNGMKTGEFLDKEITEDSLVLSSYKGHHGHEMERKEENRI
jgi:erythritol transport system ATP-binding protein